MPPAASRPPPASAEVPARLAWLDMLRGVAALVVALHHASFYFMPQTRAGMVGWFDPGKYGVLVFFLVSGYIIPASLERHGRVRGFWISRCLRIHPLLVVACLVPVLLSVLGVRELREGLAGYEPVTAVLAHLTMLQDVLGVPSAISVLWTLSYELLFYLLVVALFVTGQHRRSAAVATLLAVLAVLAAAGAVPAVALSRALGVVPVVLVTALALVAAIAAAVSARTALRVAGGVAGGVLAIVLVTMNGRAGAWEGLAILAVMFAGTAVYRAEHGQIGRRAAAASAVLVPAGAIAAGAWAADASMPPAQAREFQVYWAGSVLLAAGTFAAGWALRHRRIPRWLTGLGTISFSLYLLHQVLLMLSARFLGIPERDTPAGMAVFVLVLVLVSTLTYRCVEAPCQRLGRHLSRRPVAAERGGHRRLAPQPVVVDVQRGSRGPIAARRAVPDPPHI